MEGGGCRDDEHQGAGAVANRDPGTDRREEDDAARHDRDLESLLGAKETVAVADVVRIERAANRRCAVDDRDGEAGEPDDERDPRPAAGKRKAHERNRGGRTHRDGDVRPIDVRCGHLKLPPGVMMRGGAP